MPADNFLWFLAPAQGGFLTGKATQPQGESTDKFFSTKNALECLSISFGVTQAETTGSAGTGSGAGKVKFDEISVEKYVDLASVPLYQACTAGAHFPSVMVANRKAGGSNVLYLQYIFRMVFVTGINWSGGGGDEMPKETIKFKFGAMGIQYARQLPTGASGVPIQAYWNVLKNKPTLDVAELAGSAPQFLSVRQGG
jgi:type VI secretion system secreted protein Hcp